MALGPASGCFAAVAQPATQKAAAASKLTFDGYACIDREKCRERGRRENRRYAAMLQGISRSTCSAESILVEL